MEKNKFIWILAVCFCLIMPSLALSVKNKAPANGRSLITHSIKEVGLEFQNLRKIKGHFSGGKWNSSVDKWMGRKHQLMLHMQTLLSKEKAGKGKILEIMGPPEVILREENQAEFRFFADVLIKDLKKQGDEILIYYWRGSHDFLYFVVRKKLLIKSDWWMALE